MLWYGSTASQLILCILQHKLIGKRFGWGWRACVMLHVFNYCGTEVVTDFRYTPKKRAVRSYQLTADSMKNFFLLVAISIAVHSG